MNSDLIYLEEKIRHSMSSFSLFVLRLPKQPLEINEIISKNKIKAIFYAGTQHLQIQVDRLFNVSGTPMEKIVEDIHEQLIQYESNVGLMCNERCETSLKIYLNFMVCIEQKNFDQLRLNLFDKVFSIEQLTQYYDDIKKNQKNTLIQPKPSVIDPLKKIDRELNNEQPSFEIKIPQITNNHRIFNGYQKEDQNYLSERSRMILGREDQVISELYQSDIIIPPYIGLLEDSIKAESVVNSIRNISINSQQPLFQKEYKLPTTIQFFPYIPKDGFRCFE
ncbi:unnamed protein product [Paramecium octaurelia]|uniref:Uncharacterized protein n=2 Tax=Paramecium octaurelia TaxID=43137 RepID=A0A8S1XFW7_PAROT|nr:unnamed protein product [Paramecium octaurelia]